MTLTRMPGGTVHSVHNGDQVCEKENEFHARYTEGLGNIQGETVRSLGLESRQVLVRRV